MDNFINIFQPEYPKKDQGKLKWGNLPGITKALAILNLSLNCDDPILVIAKNPNNAQRLKRELTQLNDQLPNKKIPIYHLPDWETLPYDLFSPHQDIISERILALSKIPQMTNGILIIPSYSALYRLSPFEHIVTNSFNLTVNSKLDLNKTTENLTKIGYIKTTEVSSPGEFATRGSIFDVYPMGSEYPIRIDLFADQIDSIRIFDAQTQLSIEKIANFEMLPAKEYCLDEKHVTTFRNNWHKKFPKAPLDNPIYQKISNYQPANGVEYYIPLFFEQTSCVFDYLPHNTVIIKDDGVKSGLDEFLTEANARYEQLKYDRLRPILPISDLFLSGDEVFANINKFKNIQLSIAQLPKSSGNKNFDSHQLPDLALNSRLKNPLAKLDAYLDSFDKTNFPKILFCAETIGRKESLRELLTKLDHLKISDCTNWHEFIDNSKNNLNNSQALTVLSLDKGAFFPNNNLLIITETDLMGEQVQQRRRRKQTSQDPDLAINNLAELKIGNPIVHIEHGVGRFGGLVNLDVNNYKSEFVIISYQNQDKLYIPVSNLHLISHYSGASVESAPLYKLGTDNWSKVKQKAKDKIKDIAAELLAIHSKRELKQGTSYQVDEAEYLKFAASFGFETTFDQQKAIDEVILDLKSSKPMDRLVCGDVGFGKTEVAMRAAFIVANNSKQVAILVPTTLLAEQHYDTFLNRFNDLAIKVEVLSRFKTKKEQDKILAELAQGTIDIIIGTHKLLQNTIKFKDLGLLVIDEEHRFGVSHKEKLKKLRANIDILTLSATPIPRTLNMAMHSIRDLSIIATAPLKRLKIKTFVNDYQEQIILEAIMREVMRAGQVYYLHNDVATIENTAQKLQNAMPNLSIAVAHGQMSERKLEKIMSDFYHQKITLLVCTTIIETGIDIPSANTIIIERADKFGLAQLHQLRGRVGRSHHQAYAYCLTPKDKKITKDAQKRLEALSSLEELGSGFNLATHDLEIRGAGEILGQEQSGNIQEIGFNLYMELLNKTVTALKNNSTDLDLIDTIDTDANTEIEFFTPALIPDDFINCPHTRLIIYKRIANAKTKQELSDLQVEIIDRFGLLPEQLKNLFAITKLKLALAKFNVKKIQANNNTGKFIFTDNPNIDPNKLIELLRSEPKKYKLLNSNSFSFTTDMPDLASKINAVNQIISKLS